MDSNQGLFDTPILLITFNRPKHAQLVFDQIRRIKPRRFYFFNDGPRKENPSDNEKCESVKNMITTIDWDCKLNTLFQERNLGCGLGPVTAINWVFNCEDRAIILEDDCVPEISFFKYCSDLLYYYENNNRIFAIGGRNELGKWHEKEASYHFSSEGVLGWATWKRAWSNFDYYIEKFREPYYLELFHKFYENQPKFYQPIAEGCAKFLLNQAFGVWDYQWTFCRAINNGLVVFPSVNLVENIGFDSEATHTKYKSKRAKVKSYEMKFPIKHNHKVVFNYDYINRLYDFHVYKSPSLKIFSLINNFVKWVTKSILLLIFSGMKIL